MSPALKKFIALGVTGLITALVTSGILPQNVADLILPHLDAALALITGLLLPEIGRKPGVPEAAVVVQVPAGTEPASVEVKQITTKERL